MNRKRKRTPRQRPSRHRVRVIILQTGLIAGLVAVGVKLEYVQHHFGPTLLARANNAEETNQVLLAPRGDILDATGHRIAYDIPAFMMDLKVKAFSDKQQLAELLATQLNQPVNTMLAFVSNPSPWVRWPYAVVETARENIVQGLKNMKDSSGTAGTQDVTFTPTEQRFYPNGTFAANTIGFVDHSGTGMAGLEAEYNAQLTGQNGEISYLRDAYGFPLQSTVHTVKPAVPGHALRLTIDETIQGFVEHEMDTLVSKYHPEHAAIIVTNPATGAILGMSSRPTYDPNQYWKGSTVALSDNWAVNNPFEPGSTFKVLTMAAGLATHVISLGETLMSGHMTVAGTTIYDWNRVGWGIINFQQALEQSSNVGFATVALKLGWPNLLHYMKIFGYLDKTGIDLPSEGSSIVFGKDSQHQIQLATSGFGQGIAVTPLQQVAAVGAIANGGRLMRPYLVQDILDTKTGKVIKEIHPTVVNPQVVPPYVVKQVADTLVLDVSKGIDSFGYLPGYDVAGKTGTANIRDPKGQYYADRFNVSFIGYAPGWDPKFEVYVTLNWPKTTLGNQWGSTVATPAARDLLQQCLQYAHIEPRDTSTTKATGQNGKASLTAYSTVPQFVGQSSAKAAAAAKKVGLLVQSIGSSGTVYGQWPQAGIQVPKGTTVYTSTVSAAGQPVIMPNLSGASMREVGNMLAALGLDLIPKGSGFATSQSVSAGQQVVPGTAVVVSFGAPSHPDS